MAGRIRVLDTAKRTMQRLGFLKALCVLVNETETSNVSSVGKRLIERISKTVRISAPFDEQVRDYVKHRLTDRAYRDLRKHILEDADNATVSFELQDLYLADPALPSRTGKLVRDDWKRYPYLGTSIELIKKGTYSPLTRSLVLLETTPREERAAWVEYNPAANPMRLTDAQAAILLFCFLDNDAEVALPLFERLAALPDSTFDERIAGEFLPEIFRKIVTIHRTRGVNVEERNRLTQLTKTANTIEKWHGKSYTGGGAREEAIRVRLEPYCDMGFLEKPDRDRYEYCVSPALRILLEAVRATNDVDALLQGHLFSTFAKCRQHACRDATDEEAKDALVQAGEALKSSLGYSPITDVGLLAGVRLLTEKNAILELARTTELLRQLQRKDPERIRFTVDRMGTLAYVKFLKPAERVVK